MDIPDVPRGYYIAVCEDPEGGCKGWHLYRHAHSVIPKEETDNLYNCVTALGGYCWPTGPGYCDYGAPLTMAWVDGLVKPAARNDQGEMVYPTIPGMD